MQRSPVYPFRQAGLYDTHIYGYVGTMKTTIELPDELFREAKSVAALRNLKLKDLFTRGLEMALKAERKAAKDPTPLETMRMVREDPLHSSEDIRKAMDAMQNAKKSGWEKGTTAR
jgi:hypothetical protein